MNSPLISLPEVNTSAWRSSAEPHDVESIDALILAMYSVISGPANTPRDWVRFEGLYAPGARMIRLVTRGPGAVDVESLTPQEYRESREAVFLRTGFYEVETARRVVHYGALAHAWSTYEGRLTREGPSVLRGANSIQAIKRHNRWWLLTVVWEHESDQHPLPAELL